MSRLTETSDHQDKDESQSEYSDSSYDADNSNCNIADIDSSNPLSIQNLLNHHESFDFQSLEYTEDVQTNHLSLEVAEQNNNKNNTIKSENSQHCTESSNHKFTLEQFIEYLNLKINGDKYKKITKDTLNIFYKQVQAYLKLGALTRSEKRSKLKVFMKLYKVSSSVIYFLEYKPRIFLDPILLHIKFKINNRKKYQPRNKSNNLPSNCLNFNQH